MITNKIKIIFVGHVGIYDIHQLIAKGLNRLIATNTEDGTVICPSTLVERSDLGNKDYNICVDIFQHIWMAPGADESFRLSEINWKHLGSSPDEVSMKAFIKRYGFEDVFQSDEDDGKTNFLDRTTVNATIITRFNFSETDFLGDMATIEDE